MNLFMVFMMALCSETISMGIPRINGFKGGNPAGVSQNHTESRILPKRHPLILTTRPFSS